MPSCPVHATFSPITPKRNRKSLAWGWNLLWAHLVKLLGVVDQQRFFSNFMLALQVTGAWLGSRLAPACLLFAHVPPAPHSPPSL